MDKTIRKTKLSVIHGMEKNSKPTANKLFRVPKFKKFSLPEGFLNQLNEFSGGGFVLLLKDDKGDISTYSKFDTSSDALSMIKFGTDWFGSQEAASQFQIGRMACGNNQYGDDQEDWD